MSPLTGDTWALIICTGAGIRGLSRSARQVIAEVKSWVPRDRKHYFTVQEVRWAMWGHMAAALSPSEGVASRRHLFGSRHSKLWPTEAHQIPSPVTGDICQSCTGQPFSWLAHVSCGLTTLSSGASPLPSSPSSLQEQQSRTATGPAQRFRPPSLTLPA
jgi:hypothetical protein